MTCLKSVNGLICMEVGGCLISYSLQLVCVRKSDGATFVLDDLFCKSSGQIVLQTDVPDYDPCSLGSGPTKPKQKRHPLTTLLSAFSGTVDLLSLRCSEPSLPRLSVIALIVTAEFSPS